jgi:ribosomal subunit interface protein
MIQKLEINGIHLKPDQDLRKYVTKKIGKLDRFLSKHARTSAHAEVFLKEEQARGKKKCTCEVVLHLPKDTLTTKESTINIYAAVDIVEAKLKNQLRKYKETHGSRRLHRRILQRLKRNP